MTAAGWLGDCGDVIAADPFGYQRALILDTAIRTAITMFGNVFALSADQCRELYEAVLGYDPSVWDIPNDPFNPETWISDAS